jgi:hypothetical protein
LVLPTGTLAINEALGLRGRRFPRTLVAVRLPWRYPAEGYDKAKSRMAGTNKAGYTVANSYNQPPCSKAARVASLMGIEPIASHWRNIRIKGG